MSARQPVSGAMVDALEQQVRARVQTDPRDPRAWQALAEVLEQQQRYAEALDALRCALELTPGDAALYNRFGNVLQHCGQFEGAVDVYRMALAMAPGAGLYNNLAVALKNLNRLQEAREQLQHALELDPGHVDALNTLGTVLLLAGDPAAAIARFRMVLEQNPRHANAYCNVGIACQALGDLRTAQQMYETALAIDGSLAEAHWNRALLWLQQGDFARGWPEYRWGRATGDRPNRQSTCAPWQGEDLHGKRILIHAEQGFGDTLQFARLLPALRDRGAHVVFECPRPLLELMDDSALADELVPVGAALPAAHYGAWLLDLPALLKLRLESVPAPRSYLKVNPVRQARWREYLKAFPGLRVGVCWSGGPAYRANARRSCALADMAPLASVEGVALFNLQRGDAAAQAMQPPAGMVLQPLDTEWDQFADMAAAIASLDLVITVDTSVAHLAGALGVPTWTLLADVADWRWLLDRDDTPWYPAMKLFRQSRPGGWRELMARVVVALQDLVQANATTMSATGTGVVNHGRGAIMEPRDEPDTQVAARLREAMDHHGAGRYEAAARLYEQILEREPDNADALRLLGTIAQRRGDLEQAARHMERALAAVPDSALIYSSLGHVYQEQQATGLALQCFQASLKLDPTHADAWLGLGISHQIGGDLDAAVCAYQQLLALYPDHQRALFNLALALQAATRYEEAGAALQRLLTLVPEHVQARVQLGQLYMRADQLEPAAEQFSRALLVDGGSFDAQHLLGTVRKDQGLHEQAIEAFERALALRPDAMGVYNNLGNTYRAMGRPEDAERCYRKAVELDPQAPEAYNNLGTLYKDAGHLSQAREWFEKTLAVAPDFAFALGNLAKVYQETCAWDRYQPVLERLIAETDRLLAEGRRVPMPPFFSLSLPVSAAYQQRVARNYAQTVVLRGLAGKQLSPNPQLDRGGRLRIGYVSSDFHNHATAQLMLSLFGLHDRSAFEVYAYSLGKDDGSEYRKRIANDCDRFVDVRDWHYADIAQRIADDRIHILVDLKGYTMDIKPEIFALRPAPVQVSYLGFPGTMGAGFMDYIVTDQIVTPPDQQPYYDEAFAYLPGSYQVNDHQQVIAERTPSRGECGLPEYGFVFCCFNNNYKIEPEVFGVWMRILQQVPGSVLWLLRASPEARTNLRAVAKRLGVDPQRLVFAERQPKAEHLARHRLADLFLDTFYYNAHTTASDALWAGLPVLTCPGETFASRVGASLVSAVGLPELVAASRDDYERKAVALAQDANVLAALRARIPERAADRPLFDTLRFARNLETAYREMWRRHASGEPLSIIRVGETAPQPRWSPGPGAQRIAAASSDQENSR